MSTRDERDRLHSESGTVMEKVIVDRFLLSKLQLSYLDIAVSLSAGAITGSKLSIAIAKRHASATHQFGEAARHLARVRELGTEISPNDPTAMAVSLKVYEPDMAAMRRRSA